jgi:uncharacterized iron-regulated membrane protein
MMGTSEPVAALSEADRSQIPWQLWLDHPEKSWVRNIFFQVHFWVGAVVGAYIFVMSVSGSLIVYRNELSRKVSIEWLVDLHENLLAGSTGRWVNGIGAVCLALLCVTGAVIWWPGTKYWRRSLTVEWRASFARINWDLHSAAGLWCFLFVLMWAVSGIYLVFQDQFVVSVFLDPAGRVASWLTQLHVGRFNGLTEAVWALLGLIPAVLAFTGVFICCRRVIFKKPSNPNQTAN